MLPGSIRCMMRSMTKSRRNAGVMTRKIGSRTRPVVLVALAALGLSACDGSSMRRSLGLDSRGPDEFRVVSRAPLDVPPDFGLRPPQPGATRPNELSVREQAKQTVFGASAPAVRMVAGRSSGESVLLRQAGAIDLDATIRETVNRESAQLAQADRSLTDRLIFWRDPPPPGTVVEPLAGQQR